MSANDKQKEVERAIGELAEAASLSEIEEIEKRGYESARGNNSRKNALWAAVAQAKNRIGVA